MKNTFFNYNVKNKLIIIPVILLYLFSLIALVVGGAFFFNQAARERMLAWPQADAKIISGEVKQKSLSNRIYWMPVWKYSYSVGATSYAQESDSLVGRFRGSWWEDKAAALRELDRRPINAKESVYYNPAEPDLSVLDPLSPNPHWVKLTLLFLLMGTVFIGMAVFLQRVNAIARRRGSN
jgi:Protein of unknown function (DUF3592)